MLGEWLPFRTWLCFSLCYLSDLSPWATFCSILLSSLCLWFPLELRKPSVLPASYTLSTDNTLSLKESLRQPFRVFIWNSILITVSNVILENPTNSTSFKAKGVKMFCILFLGLLKNLIWKTLLLAGQPKTPADFSCCCLMCTKTNKQKDFFPKNFVVGNCCAAWHNTLDNIKRDDIISVTGSRTQFRFMIWPKKANYIEWPKATWLH